MEIWELNEENFREFGSIIKPDERFCTKVDNFNYYSSDLIDTSKGIDTGFLEVFDKVKAVKKFEKHDIAEEVILPLKGSALLYLACTGKRSLEQKDIRTFEIRPGKGVRLKRGVWHAIPAIMSDEVFLCIILKTKTNGEDVNYTELKTGLDIVL